MSVINFKCSFEKKEEVKNIFWTILQNHYLSTVRPNTNVEYNDEGKEVYFNRMNELMENELCKVNDLENGIQIEFDSTEDAGFSIADFVYKTSMGYSDNGLTYLEPVFDNLIKQLPDIDFDAECECYDNWVSEEYSCSYIDGYFECDAEWMNEE